MDPPNQDPSPRIHSHHECYRNDTYTLADTAHAHSDGTRPLHRFVWTQSIPLEPALPVHRDCFVFDYTTNYIPGPIDPGRWRPPPGVVCHNDSVASTSAHDHAND